MIGPISFFPIVPVWVCAVLVLSGVLLFALSRIRAMPELGWRSGFLIILSCLLLDPRLVHETREPLPDRVAIIVDGSSSIKAARRAGLIEEALSSVQESLAQIPGVEVVVSRVAEGGDRGTNLFSALREVVSGIPLNQRGGAILITDGQVHDVPADLKDLTPFGPIHAVLAGDKAEFDRRLTVVSAPRFGILGHEVELSVRVEEAGRGPRGPVALTVKEEGSAPRRIFVNPGETRAFPFRLTHPGQNVFSFSVEADPREVSAANNTVPVVVNAVRDRLRVLLVSGAPHMGERAWRNLLKSDPAVDLVHFTILRSIDSIDSAVQSDLSLIPFPVDELFERKLRDFDLVIFDKYKSAGLLSPGYFRNIADYVARGGAFLFAMGSSDETEEEAASLFSTDLGSILPVSPQAGAVTPHAYRPILTEQGRRHPAIAGLDKAYAEHPWGAWFTQARVAPRAGADVLMSGADGLPLLVVGKSGTGRVAVLASDNVWLWSRGGALQGPHAQMLRSLSHWLMKEPELEEGFIKAEVSGSAITVLRRTFAPGGTATVTMTTPSGTVQQVDLEAGPEGWMSTHVEGSESGVYAFSSGAEGPRAFAVVGGGTGPERQSLNATADILAPVMRATGGGLAWLNKKANLDVRAVSSGARVFGGEGWIGVRRNGAEAVRGVQSRALIWAPFAALIILCGLFVVWQREGRRL